jgi:hypothetical protein
MSRSNQNPRDIPELNRMRSQLVVPEEFFAQCREGRIDGALLVDVAKRPCHSAREQDTVARIASQEFASLMPSTRLGGAVKLARELSQKLVQPCKPAMLTVGHAVLGHRLRKIKRFRGAMQHAAACHRRGALQELELLGRVLMAVNPIAHALELPLEENDGMPYVATSFWKKQGIDVQTQIGRGTTFRVTMPIQQASGTTLAPARTP